MAALMDDYPSARGRGLGVSKSSSSKISKLKRGGGGGGGSTTGNAPQRPPPTVYKTEPEGFRSLVQELTGPSSAYRTSQQQQQQQQPSSRLQRMAPPPLSAPPATLPASMPTIAPFAGSLPSPKFAFPFSPLVDFSPRDLMWAAGLESPGTAADMKTLAQLVASPLASPPRTPSFFSSSNFAGFSFAGL